MNLRLANYFTGFFNSNTSDKNEDVFINPADYSELKFWTSKLGISSRQLNDAIMETGSLNMNQVKRHLMHREMPAFFRLLRKIQVSKSIHF